jgi:hypothetical protein
MTIPTVHEAPNMPKYWPLERCCFCRLKTPWWFAEKDVPVCKPCAAEHEPEDVPSKAEWMAKERTLT